MQTNESVAAPPTIATAVPKPGMIPGNPEAVPTIAANLEYRPMILSATRN